MVSLSSHPRSIGLSSRSGRREAFAPPSPRPGRAPNRRPSQVLRKLRLASLLQAYYRPFGVRWGCLHRLGEFIRHVGHEEEHCAHPCKDSTHRIDVRRVALDRNDAVRGARLLRRASFTAQYARAREIQADGMVDEMLDIADDARNDWMEKRGELVPDNEAIHRSRLRIDARRWVAGKLRPNR
jgi:hypothetical protein